MTAAQITLMGLISNGDKSETFLATGVEPKKDRAMNAPAPRRRHRPAAKARAMR